MPSLAHQHWHWHPPSWWKREAKCIHHYEGGWSAVDSSGTYFGGFQADRSFQAAYGRWAYRHYGTADHWIPHRQYHMAWRGWRHRGWEPWPSTRVLCGL